MRKRGYRFSLVASEPRESARSARDMMTMTIAIAIVVAWSSANVNRLDPRAVLSRNRPGENVTPRPVIRAPVPSDAMYTVSTAKGYPHKGLVVSGIKAHTKRGNPRGERRFRRNFSAAALLTSRRNISHLYVSHSDVTARILLWCIIRNSRFIRDKSVY